MIASLAQVATYRGAGIVSEVMMRAPNPAEGDLPQTWLNSFQGFSLQHLVMSGSCFGIMALWIWLGRRWRDTEQGSRLRVFVAGLGLMSQLIMMIYWAEPARRSHAESWPLHLCDLAAILAPFALLFPSARSLTTIVFFWGVGLSSQAFIQPTVQRGMESATFWFYWIQHTFIVGVGLYAVALGYRPRWRDWWLVLAVDLGLLVTVMPLNVAFGLNYMFIGNAAPDGAPLIEALGPWPMRAFVMFALAHVILALIVLGFQAWARFTQSDATRPTPNAPSASASEGA